MLKSFYDWLVVPPADLVAYCVLLPLGFAPLLATGVTWLYTVNYLDDTTGGRPVRARTYFIAGIISAYVFLVTGTALFRLPHVLYELTKNDGD